MTYQELKQRNDENKARFNQAKKMGTINLGTMAPYTSFSIESLRGDTMEIKSNIRGCYTTCQVQDFISHVFADSMIHCSNPSRLSNHRLL